MLAVDACKDDFSCCRGSTSHWTGVDNPHDNAVHVDCCHADYQNPIGLSAARAGCQ